MAKQEPKYISLRFQPKYRDAAEVIARASGADGVPIMTWIIRVAATEAASRLGEPVPELPPMKRASEPPPAETIAALAESAASKGLSLADMMAALQHVIDSTAAREPGARSIPPSGTRPALRPGEYALTRNMTPAGLNKAIREGHG